MKTNKLRWTGLLCLIASLVCLVLPAQMIGASDFAPPQAFWGSLTHADGTPAPAGRVITATVNGIDAGTITTTQAGEYGNEYEGFPKLNVMGDFADGANIRFWVDGNPAYYLVDDVATTYYRFKSGEITNLDLFYTPPSQQFYGSVYMTSGTPAPAGSLVTARVDGVEVAGLTTTLSGYYGDAGDSAAGLTVTGDFTDDAAVSFYVNGVLASFEVDGQTAASYPFKNGEITQLDLTYGGPVQEFYGTLYKTTGSQAPAGVTVYAKINGTVYGSLTTTEAGQYGGAGDSDTRLIVQGDIADGTVITFYVDQYAAKETTLFSAGQTTELNLTYTPSTSSGGGGGGGSSGTTTTTTTTPATTTTTTTPTTTTAAPTVHNLEIVVNGNSVSSTIGEDGRIQTELIIRSPQGDVDLLIPAGTLIQWASGLPERIIIESVAAPMVPPEHYTFVSRIFHCQPDGTTFSPPVSLEFSFELPEGVNAGEITAGFYSNGEWTLLDAAELSIDQAAGSAAVLVDHFSYYALLAPVSPAATSVSASATSTPTATVTAVSTSVTTVTQPAGEAGFPWWIIVVIVALLILVVAIVVVARNRRLPH